MSGNSRRCKRVAFNSPWRNVLALTYLSNLSNWGHEFLVSSDNEPAKYQTKRKPHAFYMKERGFFPPLFFSSASRMISMFRSRRFQVLTRVGAVEAFQKNKIVNSRPQDEVPLPPKSPEVCHRSRPLWHNTLQNGRLLGKNACGTVLHGPGRRPAESQRYSVYISEMAGGMTAIKSSSRLNPN